VTTPEAETVATAGVPLLQAPPATVCVNDVVVFSHNESVPVIGAGDWLTVTGFVATQPVVSV
jgi:hypothetical protein